MLTRDLANVRQSRLTPHVAAHMQAISWRHSAPTLVGVASVHRLTPPGTPIPFFRLVHCCDGVVGHVTTALVTRSLQMSPTSFSGGGLTVTGLHGAAGLHGAGRV